MGSIENESSGSAFGSSDGVGTAGRDGLATWFKFALTNAL
jgi:hypothetical protein